MATTSEDPQKQPEGPSNGSKTEWDAARRQLELSHLTLEAYHKLQDRLLTVATQYQQTLKDIAKDLATAELAIVDAIVADFHTAETAESVGAARQAWYKGILEARQDASRRVVDAGSQLVGEQRRAWLDHSEALTEVFRDPSVAPPAGGPFTVPGDELSTMPPMPWGDYPVGWGLPWRIV